MFKASDPAGAAGRRLWYPSRDTELYLNKLGDARGAAGVTVHETQHYLERITPWTYNNAHEIRACQWQHKAGFLPGWDDTMIEDFVNTSPLYSHVRPGNQAAGFSVGFDDKRQCGRCHVPVKVVERHGHMVVLSTS